MSEPSDTWDWRWPATLEVHRSSHTQSSTDHGPDYCAECSDKAQDWVKWPCPTVGATDDQRDDHEANDRKARTDERRAALAHGLACDQRDAWEELAMGLDHLLAHYRSGSTPSGALLDRIKKTREQVAALKREAREQ